MGGRGEGPQPRNVCDSQSDSSFTATLQTSHGSLCDTPLQEHPGKGVLGTTVQASHAVMSPCLHSTVLSVSGEHTF